MDPPRPPFLDLRSMSSASQRSVKPAMRSPRLHVAGEAPPELSPLDAFAMQSRLLAKQLEDSNKEGRRMSRLPPLTTESPLVVQSRSEYFRAMSQDSASDNGESPSAIEPAAGLGLRTEVEEPIPELRPRSMHPRMSHMPPAASNDGTAAMPLPVPSFSDMMRGRAPVQSPNGTVSFGVRREASPEMILEPSKSGDEQQQQLRAAANARFRSSSHSFSTPRPPFLPDSRSQSPDRPTSAIPHSRAVPSALSNSPSKKDGSSEAAGLAPPRTLFPRRSSSIMSGPPDVDDQTPSIYGRSPNSRKMSSSSSVFSGHGPVPGPRPPSVTPSIASDLPRPSFNFSRPMSRAGTPSLDLPMPTRQMSADSQQSFPNQSDDVAHTPVSMSSDAFENFEDGRSPGSSYIYSTYTLPRGKTIQRSVPLDSAVDEVDESSDSVKSGSNEAPPSPPTRPSSSSSRPNLSNLSLPAAAAAAAAPTDNATPADNDGVKSTESKPKPEPLQLQTATTPLSESARLRTAMSAAATTSDGPSTIRQRRSSLPTASEMTAEEHLQKGIECHENGSLSESTYHLRIAAQQKNPTAMLLYALACRHGWGMRPNQAEGVDWLRKAAELAHDELAEDEEQAKEGKRVNTLESKTRKAQFALSIYELGVSHMNGWGIEQDKRLALKCFEIAGNWGDVDALAEAGFCYAQGMGCKKDLKKSAKFYRMAEAKGMSMVGNSWIHKAKYDSDDESKKKKGKGRGHRHLFGHKA
ncbi:hypothetical protein TD95_003665 [Thielaviopsis punctulata]|uniref:Cell cycle inhibitor Nif1 n=1 Tax=Thielaviopsis punctulata TaxID=72032 RepID=A0A0F4ZJV2_9PEZI|nr:hypothetical protein TD95_003665 [Thielaviopsis punctulata]